MVAAEISGGVSGRKNVQNVCAIDKRLGTDRHEQVIIASRGSENSVRAAGDQFFCFASVERRFNGLKCRANS